MSDAFSEKSALFEKWMVEAGIKISTKVKLHDYRGQNQGRGFIATADLCEGEQIFAIPFSALVTASSVPELEGIIAELDEWSQLIVTMLFVASKRWEPYFGVLPTEFNTPMFWSDEELKLLEPSALVNKIGREQATEMYESLKPVLTHEIFAGIDTSEQAFHRMASLIMAYGFDVLKGGETDEETIKAMVPPADMLNSHSKFVNARLEMPEQEGDMLEMVATVAIPAGSQIYNFYGEQPNSDLLRRYGYVEAGGNASDVVEISLDSLVRAAQVDPKVVAKWEKYDEAEIVDEAFDIGDQGIPDPDIIAMANMLATDKPSKKAYRECIEMAEEEQLSDKAREILIAAVNERLAEYANVDTTTSETETGVYTDVESMCRQVVGTEKSLLQLSLGWLDDGTKRRRVD